MPNLDFNEVNGELVARKVEIVSELGKILKLLPMGTNIPLWSEFSKYITFDLKHFNAQSLLLTENDIPTGHALLFCDGKKVLYFGFFGVSNDTQERIEFLAESIVEYAQNNGFETVRGPVNVPTIIYGWGFMEEGSSTSLFVHNPVNAPIYPYVFRQKGFTEVLKEYSFEGNFRKLNPEFLESYSFDDYELVVFDNWEQIASVKIDFMKLNIRNLPPESVVTPSSAAVFENYLEFIKEYGDPSMIVFTRFKKTNKLIGCFLTTPNPFDKSSFVLFAIALDKKHRSKGLGWLMINEILAKSLERGINYCSAPVGSHVDRSIEISNKLRLPLLRTHTVFSYSIVMKQELSFQERLEKVFELLTLKDNKKAIELAKILLEIDPESDQGWLLLGIANRRIGKLQEAITSFQKATELNRSMEEAWGLLAITYLDKNQESIASKCLLNAVKFNPSSEELKFYQQNLIRIYKTFGPFF